jgi:hypothetical protein
MQAFSLIAILQLIAAGNSVLSPKVYSAGPGAQCQAQQALDNIDQSIFETLSTLVPLPSPCSIGPWTRVAYLNIMSDPSQQCPPSWRLYSANGVRACGRQITTSIGGCNSQIYTIQQSVQYRRVCGRIIGYQIGSPDVFHDQQLSIDESYVDGVSVTYGDPRKHIWTFAGGVSETIVTTRADHACPCALMEQQSECNSHQHLLVTTISVNQEIH